MDRYRFGGIVCVTFHTKVTKNLYKAISIGLTNYDTKH